MKNFIIKVLVFLLTLFPNSAYLQGQYQLTVFDYAVTQNSITEAIKTRNVDALEAMMCKNIKQNVVDLPGEIGTLIDTIDGEITTWDWNPSSSYDAAKYGKQIKQTGWTGQIDTANATYFMIVYWEIANNFAPDEMGMRAITLRDKDHKLLVMISATEGIGEMHD